MTVVDAVSVAAHDALDDELQLLRVVDLEPALEDAYADVLQEQPRGNRVRILVDVDRAPARDVHADLFELRQPVGTHCRHQR